MTAEFYTSRTTVVNKVVRFPSWHTTRAYERKVLLKYQLILLSYNHVFI